jgi:hypothetical protein
MITTATKNAVQPVSIISTDAQVGEFRREAAGTSVLAAFAYGLELG